MAQKNPQIDTLRNKMYTNRLEIQVLHVEKEMTRDRFSGILVDSTGWIKCSIDPAKKNAVQMGKNLAITGFRVSQRMLYINSNTAVYRAGKLIVPTEILEGAMLAIGAPINPFQTIAEVIKIPTRRKVSVSGTIVTNNAKAIAGSSEKKDLTVWDGTDQVLVTLWRNVTEVETMVGQKISIKDCFIEKNKYLDLMNIHVNDASNIEISEEEPELKQIKILAIQEEDLGEQPSTSLTPPLYSVLADVDGIDRHLKMESSLLMEHLEIPKCDDSLDRIVNRLPFTFEGKIVSLTIKK